MLYGREVIKLNFYAEVSVTGGSVCCRDERIVHKGPIGSASRFYRPVITFDTVLVRNSVFGSLVLTVHGSLRP